MVTGFMGQAQGLSCQSPQAPQIILKNLGWNSWEMGGHSLNAMRGKEWLHPR